MTGQPINPGQPPPPNLVASLLEDRNATSRQIQDLLMEKNGTAIGGVQAINLDEKRCQQDIGVSATRRTPFMRWFVFSHS